MRRERMLTSAERAAWLDASLRTHPTCKPLAIHPPPDLSVSNVAYREAQQAWLTGLFVSTVLCSYAACEITLAFRYSMALTMAPDNFTVEWDEMVKQIADADRKVKPLKLKPLIKGLRLLGQPMDLSLSSDLMKLAGYRNSLAHFRPVLKNQTIVSSEGDSFVASFQQADVVKPETQERYAQHGVETMFDLWSAPVTNGMNLDSREEP